MVSCKYQPKGRQASSQYTVAKLIKFVLATHNVNVQAFSGYIYIGHELQARASGGDFVVFQGAKYDNSLSYLTILQQRKAAKERVYMY